MNTFRQLRYKTKIGAVLVFIISVILLNNIVSRMNFTKLDNSIAAIYNDRLMPATYIFQLTDHLYQKKLLLEQSNALQNAVLRQKMQSHNAAILSLVTAYEATKLTIDEKRYWQTFKTELVAYQHEALNPQQSPVDLEAHFARVINSLTLLSNLQAGEGNHIRESSVTLIGNSTFGSSLEIALMLVLAMLTVSIVGSSKNAVLQAPQKPSLN